jgi:protein-S-isoprenylcysteine O-methyltransferase Ste14
MTNVTPEIGRAPLTTPTPRIYAVRNPREPSAKQVNAVSLRIVVSALWIAFGLYWLIAAAGAKQGSRRIAFPPGLLVLVAVILLRVFRPGGLVVHSVPLQIVGLILLLDGMALAVWARIYLGRNWGMPMTRKAEPELVTSGPYHFVRHPIYSGLLVAILGTALATEVYWLIALPVMGAYFIYSATVEERLMTTAFPADYPSYKEHTKMLVPFVL